MKLFIAMTDVKSWLNNFLFRRKVVEIFCENFELAFDFTIKNEGGYSNHKNDLGGETYKGISRYYHPNWPGWITIDNLKKEDNWISKLENSEDLQECVKSFYYNNYWMAICGDDIEKSLIAIKLFDMAVSLGIRRTVEYLQESLFVLKRDIKIDGIFGPQTLSILNKFCHLEKNEKRLLKCLYTCHINHYIKICLSRPKQRVFINGWIDRASRRFGVSPCLI